MEGRAVLFRVNWKVTCRYSPPQWSAGQNWVQISHHLNGSGCGTVDSMVTSDTRRYGFKSKNRQLLLNNFFKTAKIKKKLTEMAHFYIASPSRRYGKKFRSRTCWNWRCWSWLAKSGNKMFKVVLLGKRVKKHQPKIPFGLHKWDRICTGGVIKYFWALIVAQLVKQLSTPEIRGSNPVIGNFSLISTALKTVMKRRLIGPILKIVFNPFYNPSLIIPARLPIRLWHGAL